MSGCKAMFSFYMDGKREFERMPKGDLLRLGVNPYNGKVVLVYQDAEDWRDVMATVLAQLCRQAAGDEAPAALRDLVERCEGYLGEKGDGRKAIVAVRGGCPERFDAAGAAERLGA